MWTSPLAGTFSEQNNKMQKTHGYDIDRMDQGVILVVLKQHGRMAPGAQALFHRLLHHRTQLLVRQGTQLPPTPQPSARPAPQGRQLHDGRILVAG